MTEELKEIINPKFEKNLLYRSAAGETKTKLQTVIDLCATLVGIAEANNLSELESVLLVKCFLEEQASFDNETGTWFPRLVKSLTQIVYNLHMILMPLFEEKVTRIMSVS